MPHEAADRRAARQRRHAVRPEGRRGARRGRRAGRAVSSPPATRVRAVLAARAVAQSARRRLASRSRGSALALGASPGVARARSLADGPDESGRPRPRSASDCSHAEGFDQRARGKEGRPRTPRRSSASLTPKTRAMSGRRRRSSGSAAARARAAGRCRSRRPRTRAARSRSPGATPHATKPAAHQDQSAQQIAPLQHGRLAPRATRAASRDEAESVDRGQQRRSRRCRRRAHPWRTAAPRR